MPVGGLDVHRKYVALAPQHSLHTRWIHSAVVCVREFSGRLHFSQLCSYSSAILWVFARRVLRWLPRWLRCLHHSSAKKYGSWGASENQRASRLNLATCYIYPTAICPWQYGSRMERAFYLKMFRREKSKWTDNQQTPNPAAHQASKRNLVTGSNKAHSRGSWMKQGEENEKRTATERDRAQMVRIISGGMLFGSTAAACACVLSAKQRPYRLPRRLWVVVPPPLPLLLSLSLPSRRPCIAIVRGRHQLVRSHPVRVWGRWERGTGEGSGGGGKIKQQVDSPVT